MKTSKKVFLSVILIIFVGISLFASLNMLARPTYEFGYSSNEGGYIFEGFNGNSTITKVVVDKVLVKTRTSKGNVWLPDESKNVVAVDQYTIISDEYIERIHIGPNVKRIDEKAFVYCKALKSITVDDSNPYYKDIDGVLFTGDMKTLLAFPICHETNGEVTREYTIPEGIERLAKNSFYKCESLYHVYFPDSLIEIGDMSFFKCWWLQTVKLPENLKTIGCDAFSFCTGFRYSFYIPESVESIGHHCFYKSDAIERFYIGGSEDSVELGGKWQPKSENALYADEPIFNSTYEECQEYFTKRAIEEGEILEEETTQEEETEEETAEEPQEERDEMNTTAVIILVVFVLIPCFAIVGVEVVRNLFKEDFLMTKKGKAKLQRLKEEKEYIHKSYLNDGELKEEEDKEDE